MFVDACAIVSLITDEPTAPAYDEALRNADHAATSILAVWEAVIVLSHPLKLDRPYRLVETIVLAWMEQRGIRLSEPASPREVLSHAIAVAEKYGTGKRRLSSFDCFHYAYAKALGAPLLTLDEKLRETDIPTLP